MSDLKERLGKVKIIEEMMWDPATMGALFSGCVILDVTSYDYYRHRVYVFASPEIDRLRPGELIPEYTAEMEHNGTLVTRRKWVKL